MERGLIVAAIAFVGAVMVSRVIFAPGTSAIGAAALGNPSGSVPYTTGAAAMGPIGGLF